MPTPITASMLYDLVICPHRITMDLYGDPAKMDETNPFVKMLWEKGLLYEREGSCRRCGSTAPGEGSCCRTSRVGATRSSFARCCEAHRNLRSKSAPRYSASRGGACDRKSAWSSGSSARRGTRRLRGARSD